jgi:hypothetical protein
MLNSVKGIEFPCMKNGWLTLIGNISRYSFGKTVHELGRKLDTHV